ncbi:hypothetical protein [Lentzea jiangxiensis]|nr:hypothetical protein [Lentzea jiangxiensis]
MKVIAAAVVGAACGAGWYFSLMAALELPCSYGPFACSVSRPLLYVPVLVVLWGVAAWGLLWLARVRPAWPVALAGVAIMAALAFALVLVLLVLLRWWALPVVVPFAGAVGHGLAAKATAGYRGQLGRRRPDGAPAA